MQRRSRLRRSRVPETLAAAGLSVLVGACGGSATPSTSASRPNLLLVTIDTLRADRLGCYGGEPDVGQFICSLADSGTRFEWAFAAAPYTAPSIASVLTGRYPSFHRVRQATGSYLAREFETLPELLQSAGYQTAAFVSNPVLESPRQLDQGFEVFDQEMNREERNRPSFVEREAQSTTDAALAWAQISAHPPWFMWVHFQDPHGPYEPPDTSTGHDEPGGTPLPVLEKDNQSGLGGIPFYQALPGLLTREAYESRYLDEIRYLDPHLRRLVEGLDALGDPPAVLITSDHGESFGEDGYYFAHGHSVGLDQIRVPLLWRPAEPAAATVERAPVSLVDVAPTLLRAASVPVPEDFQGRPLPVAGSGVKDPEESRPIFAEHVRRAAIIVGDSYYARDRWEVDEDEIDPNSGGRFKPLPPRSARLDTEGALPPYVPAERDETSAALEPPLANFLDAAGRIGGGARNRGVSAEMQAQLRALGYMD